MTNIPWRHIGFKTGSDGSNTANSYKAIDPAHPATKAVCIKCTDIKRPGSLLIIFLIMVKLIAVISNKNIIISNTFKLIP